MGNPISIQLLTGATPTWDALYKFAKITASGNVAITISGAGTPDGGVLHFKQDATGSRTLTINGTSITVNTAAGSLTRVDWGYDGEDYTYHTNVQGGASGSVVQLLSPTLSATAVSDTQIDVVVGTVANASSYEVQESTDNTNWTTIGTTAGTYNRTGKTASTQYYYRAKAVGNGTTYTDSSYATANATTDAVGSTYDADAQAYFDRVTAAGGTLTTTEQDAWNDFVTSAKGSSYYSKFKFAYPYLGTNNASRVLNAISSSYNATINGGVTFDANGADFDGSTGYLDTNLNPSTAFADIIMAMGVAVKESTYAAVHVDMGVFDTPNTKEIGLLVEYTDGKAYTTLGDQSASTNVGVVSHANTPAFWVSSRYAANNFALYRNGVSVGSNGNTDPDTSLANGALYVGASHNMETGAAQSFSARGHKFTFVSTGLSAAEVASLHTHLSTFLTAIGR